MQHRIITLLGFKSAIYFMPSDLCIKNNTDLCGSYPARFVSHSIFIRVLHVNHSYDKNLQ